MRFIMPTETFSYKRANSLYPYNPSIPASIVFIVLFASIFIIKVWDHIRFCRSKATTFPYDSEIPQDERMLRIARKQVSVSLIPIYVAIIVEILGYSLRIISIFNRDSVTLYTIPAGLIMMAPSFIVIGVLTIFCKVAQFLHGGKFSIIPTGFLTAFIVTGDVGCSLVQVVGGTIMLQDSTGEQLGLVLGFVGLGLRVALYAFFILVIVIWLWRMIIQSTEVDVAQLMDINESGYNWRRIIQGLLASMVLVLIRCILRTAEFAETTVGEGHFARSEAAYYMIDAIIIFWSCVVLVALRPEYRLWEIKTYQVWTEMKRTGNNLSTNELEGPVVWRRTSWMYS